jgi:hypothetical protein
MRNASRAALTACVVVCSLALAAGSASASRAIRIEPVGEITKVVNEFTITAFGGEVRVRCRLVLRGRLVGQVQKVRVLPAGRFGQITFGEASECRSNLGPARVIILIEPNRPVDLRFEAFLGALPNITGILFRKLAFELKVDEAVIGNCLFSGDVLLLVRFPPVEEGGGRRFTEESFSGLNLVPLVAGFPCAESVTLSGRGRVTPPLRAVLVND